MQLPRRPHQPGGAPPRLLCDYLGPPRPIPTAAVLNCCLAHVDELRALAVPVTAPERLWVLQQQEDEVLDYRKALDEYRFARLSLGAAAITPHRLRALPAQIVRFLGL